MTKVLKKRGRHRKIVEPIEGPVEYFLQLHLADRIYFGDGLSMLEALQNLEKPQKVITKGTLKIQVGNKKRSMLLSVPQVKRLFYPLSQQVLAKQFSFGLK